MQTEALIVGGGPAGLAASIALAQRGVKCTVVEARTPQMESGQSCGLDKPCSEGLMPETVAALAELGVAIPPNVGWPFRGIRFVDAEHSVEAQFPAAAGRGVRRTTLHRLLAERAEAVGVRLMWGSHIELPASVQADEARVNGEAIRYCWLIGADGLASGVRRWAGLDATRYKSSRLAFRTHLRVAPGYTEVQGTGMLEVHWMRKGQISVIPIAEDTVCITCFRSDGRAPLAEVLRGSELAERLSGAEELPGRRGAATAVRVLRRVAAGKVALVGDASGSVDAITGEGLALSFFQAAALVESIAADSLEGYARNHARIARLPLTMGALMLAMDRWPVIGARAMRALSTHPHLFRELVAVHVGAQSISGFTLRRAPQLGWHLVWG